MEIEKSIFDEIRSRGMVAAVGFTDNRKAEADDIAERELVKNSGFQRYLIDGITDTLYGITALNVDMESFSDIKNFYLAQGICKFEVEADNPATKPFIDLYDDMVPGKLHDPDSGEFLVYLIQARHTVTDEAI